MRLSRAENVRAHRATSPPLATAAAGPLSVARVMGILRLLAHRPAGESLAEMSRELGAPKTSLVGLLKGLQQLEYVVRHDDRYRLGSASTAFATSVLPGLNFFDLARPILAELVRRTGETALLGVPSPEKDFVIYTDKVESDNPVRYTVPIGEQRELYCSAVGKCVLAFLERDRIARYLKGHPLQARTAKTITSASKLHKELERIRETRLAYSEDERVIGASAVAAPVFAPGPRFVAALVVGGPTSRVRMRRREHASAVAEAADALSGILGFERREESPK